MGFDWGTFIAQILNLFVLVWLMKRFLYQPIINTITKRQAILEEKVHRADEAVREAQRQQAVLTRQAREWELNKQKRTDALFAALEDTRQQQQEKLAEQAEENRQKMQADLEREAGTLQFEIRDMMAHNFLDLSRKVLMDISDVSHMAQAVSLFRSKVLSLSKTELNNIKKSYKKHGVINVCSSSALTEKERADLLAFLMETFDIADQKCFQIAVQPDLIFGIEVVIGDTILEWNFKTYLDTFETNLNAALAGLVTKES